MNFLKPSHHEYEFQMVSFVDVIFVLLSFFVLGSSFRMPEKDFGLAYARAGLPGGARTEDFPANVQVRLRANGQGLAMWVGQARLPDNDFSALQAHLTQINMPDLEVLILAEKQLSVEQVAQAMDAVLASPMKRISIAALGPPGAKPAPAAAPEATRITGGR